MQPDQAFLITEGGLQREQYHDPPPFTPGQPVIWTYRPQWRRREVHAVAAEVVQITELRIRICVHTASGRRLLRWVHPKNLRASEPDEPADAYQEPL